MSVLVNEHSYTYGQLQLVGTEWELLLDDAIATTIAELHNAFAKQVAIRAVLTEEQLETLPNEPINQTKQRATSKQVFLLSEPRKLNKSTIFGLSEIDNIENIRVVADFNKSSSFNLESYLKGIENYLGGNFDLFLEDIHTPHPHIFVNNIPVPSHLVTLAFLIHKLKKNQTSKVLNLLFSVRSRLFFRSL